MWRKRQLLQNVKRYIPFSKKNMTNVSVTVWPLFLCPFFQSASQSHHISSYYQWQFHVLFYPLALHINLFPFFKYTVELYVRGTFGGNRSKPKPPYVAVWYIEQNCCGEEQRQFKLRSQWYRLFSGLNLCCKMLPVTYFIPFRHKDTNHQCAVILLYFCLLNLEKALVPFTIPFLYFKLKRWKIDHVL